MSRCPRLERLPARELAGGRRVAEAKGLRARMLGLALLDELPPDWGLHIPKCKSVHTFGMRFALDLIWLDRDGAVVEVQRDVPRRRNRACRAASSVVEVGAGQADAFVAAGV